MNRFGCIALASALLAACGTPQLPAASSSAAGFSAGSSQARQIVNLDDWNDTSLWQRQNGYSNGGDFDVGWRADHATVSRSQLDITLNTTPCPSGCSGKPYASDELDSVPKYSYGTYTVRMRTAKSAGVVSTFFTYINLTPHGKETNDEIDVEIPGERTHTLEGTYYKEGGPGIEHTIQLPFDSSEAMHTYAIRWLPNSISWIVDGHVLYTAHGSKATMPTHPSYFILNFWSGDTKGIINWLGALHYKHPLHALYGSASYQPATP